jgi:hypothetical protein
LFSFNIFIKENNTGYLLCMLGSTTEQMPALVMIIDHAKEEVEDR